MAEKLLNLIEKLDSKNTLLIDTPFLVYHLEDIRPYSDITARILDSISVKDSRIYISLISYTEMLVGIKKKNDHLTERKYNSFFAGNPFIEIVDLSFELSEPAARIRSEKHLGLADSIIIATAINKEVRFLITNDSGLKKMRSKDFEVILLDELLNS